MSQLPSAPSWAEDQEAQRKERHAERRVWFKWRVSNDLSRRALKKKTSGTDDDEEEAVQLRISFLERLRYFKWNWFTVVMATGGVADAIYSR
jgi:hypothetical protein